MSDLLLEVRRKRTIERAWAAVQRNARTSKSPDTRKQVEEFATTASTRLRTISDQLRKGSFSFGRARGVKIAKGKGDRSNFRPLIIATVEARIVQRAVHDVLLTVPEVSAYVRTPFSFGGVRKNEADELAAVPAAIKAVLSSIEAGGQFIIRSDISKFFTRISKSAVLDVVSRNVSDAQFIGLLRRALAVELENMAQLREAAKAFPIEDIGVAQGNSLSPLMGNIILRDFDMELNKSSDVRCIRYVDDFLIIGPRRDVCENTFAKACSMLRKLGMEVSPTKTKRAAVSEGFEFLGIDVSNGFIRPSRQSQARVVASVKECFSESRKEFRKYREKGEIEQAHSLLETLRKAGGVMRGWGKHYWFCNDQNCFDRLDEKIAGLVGEYLATYRQERERLEPARRWRLLGIESLGSMEREPFAWPKLDRISDDDLAFCKGISSRGNYR